MTITHHKDGSYMGFLCNKMFQWASTIGIAGRHNAQYVFPHHEYFDIFEGDFPTRHPDELEGMGFETISERGFYYDQFDLSSGRYYNIEGYLQSPKYFAHCMKAVRSLFTFREDIRRNCEIAKAQLRVKDFPMAAIHARLGDYLNIKDHHTCLIDTNYYLNAIREIDPIGRPLIVFSDDQQMFSEHLDHLNQEHFGGALILINSPFADSYTEDLCLMSMMDSIICANSTFSLWAALLGNMRKTIVPDRHKWFGPEKADWDTSDLYMEHWKQIGVE